MPDDQRAFNILGLDITPRNEGPRLIQLLIRIPIPQLESHVANCE